MTTCLFRLTSRRSYHVTSIASFSVQRRLKPLHHVVISKLLPRFRTPRCIDLLHKMLGQLSANKSERYVVFYSQQVDGRKNQESSSTFVLCTFNVVNQNICTKLRQNGIHVCLWPVSFLQISPRRFGIFGQPITQRF